MPTNGFSIKPLKVELLGEQNANQVFIQSAQPPGLCLVLFVSTPGCRYRMMLLKILPSRVGTKCFGIYHFLNSVSDFRTTFLGVGTILVINNIRLTTFFWAISIGSEPLQGRRLQTDLNFLFMAIGLKGLKYLRARMNPPLESISL